MMTEETKHDQANRSGSGREAGEKDKKRDLKSGPTALEPGADTDGAGTGGMVSGKDAGGGPAGRGGTSGAGD